MSFILDALKKSEVERQRQAMPGLIDVPVAAKRRRLPWWAFALGALLLINVGVLSLVLLRGGAQQKPALARNTPSRSAPASAPSSAPASGEAQPAAAPASASDHFSPMDAPAQYAPEIPVQNPVANERPQSAPPIQPAPVPARVTHRDPVLSDAAPASADDNDEVLPTFSELNLPAGQALPDMHLDVHVYGTKAADRFVYINMRKYREGQTVQEGAVLERIRRDGAVLNYRGVRFLLPRQS